MSDPEHLKRLLEIRENFAEMYAEMLKGDADDVEGYRYLWERLQDEIVKTRKH
jgi:hypothetical protein